MGAALWFAAAVSAFLTARALPPGRPPRWWPELAASLLFGALLGLTATALDFGGWNELDWRAALFVAFGSLLGLGALRLVRVARLAT